MRRGFFILLLGLVGAALSYCFVYHLGTTTPRALLSSAQPELAWLKQEFHLSDADFSRISELHAGYLPKCKERCRRIEELNGKLSKVLTEATRVTPEVEAILADRAQLRAVCQSEMLSHFFNVSRSMPPEQGQRYLAWAKEHTCLSEQPLTPHPSSHSAAPAHHP